MTSSSLMGITTKLKYSQQEISDYAIRCIDKVINSADTGMIYLYDKKRKNLNPTAKESSTSSRK